MNLTTATHRLRPTRVQWLLLYIRSLGLTFGVLALGYVAFTLFEEVNARRDLNSQMRVSFDRPASFPQAARDGDILGRIGIPRLGMSVPLLQGTNIKNLQLGAVHIEGTALPGEAGNSGIAARLDTFFQGLRDIRQKDEIQLETASGLVRYEVDWVKVVAPEDLSVLKPARSGEPALTLVTYPCEYFGGARRRFIVHASLPRSTRP